MSSKLRASEAGAQSHSRRHVAYAGKAPAADTVARAEPAKQTSAQKRESVVQAKPAPRAETTEAELGGGKPVGGKRKRLFDIMVAGGALIVLAPLLALIALAVRLESKGPAIFKQERGGLNDRVFRIWKFRTMTVTESGDSAVQAVYKDARITRLGGILRQMSWDELPQLVNVLIGDMSLIGPRPHALAHDRQFTEIDPTYPERFRARPGITGLAQVSGCRGPTETPEKVRNRTAYDVRYVRNWSFTEDVKIVVRTVKLLLRWKDDANAF